MDKQRSDLGSFPPVSVIIPAYSMDRWDDLQNAVGSVQSQTVPVFETVLVIDHCPDLMTKAVDEFPNVTVVENLGSPGASGARNSGVAVSKGQLLAFLDDDAVARPDWLQNLLQHFAHPSVVGVGGRLEPLWKTHRPRWFPAEFDWTVGCSYRGMPEITSQVRNVWSNNMAIRRSAFDAIGGFRDGFGKIGARSRPEDTDLCLRAAEFSKGSWIYEPAAIAGHQVPAERITLKYFLHRCYSEGQGKAELASLNGVAESTSIERQYARIVLPEGIFRGLRELAHGETSGAARSSAIVVGLSSAIVGFLADRAISSMVERPSGRRRAARH